MSMHNIQQFGRGASRIVSTDNTPLELEEIRRWCPSVVAEGKHHSRSDKYSYVNTLDLLVEFEKHGFAPFSIIQGGSREIDRRGFTKHHITLRLKDSTSLRVGGTFFEVNMKNSHDGTGLTEVFAGLFKLLCLNGMRTDERSYPGVKIPHRGDSVSRVMAGANTVLEQADAVAKKAEVWSQLQLTEEEQQQFADHAAQLRFGDSTPIATRQLLFVNREADRGDDLWRVFNRVQENTIKGGLPFDRTRKTGQVIHAHTREVRSVDGDVKLNRQLWALAEEVATLKAA